ncbi:hypothetical protein SSS_09748 [Sarcoptes scabiei]|uniref:Uncharacterized protein n=1 Tax=Sarcoptes scabiei TaxID=52283 RepID=A0A834RE59_SARSC|nr:hypothetical protein SSS_09748 [Sarcoptes scabiei]
MMISSDSSSNSDLESNSCLTPRVNAQNRQRGPRYYGQVVPFSVDKPNVKPQQTPKIGDNAAYGGEEDDQYYGDGNQEQYPLSSRRQSSRGFGQRRIKSRKDERDQQRYLRKLQREQQRQQRRNFIQQRDRYGQQPPYQPAYQSRSYRSGPSFGSSYQ